MNDVVVGEVVEVKREKRPEIWVAVWRDDDDEWIVSSPYDKRESAEAVYSESPRGGDFLLCIPAEGTPAPAGEDAVERLCKLAIGIRAKYENDQVGEIEFDIDLKYLEQAAAACLTAIEGR